MKKETKNEDVNLIDKDIQNIMDRQYRKAWNDYNTSIENKKKKLEIQKIKEKRQQRIIQIIMIIVILITLTLICVWNYKIQNKFIKGCMDKGYNENYCIAKS